MLARRCFDSGPRSFHKPTHRRANPGDMSGQAKVLDAQVLDSRDLARTLPSRLERLVVHAEDLLRRVGCRLHRLERLVRTVRQWKIDVDAACF